MKIRALPFLCLILTVVNFTSVVSAAKAEGIETSVNQKNIESVKAEKSGTELCEDRGNQHPCE
jgi:hypothetical protein